jgi:hypothetical protein
VEHVGQGKDEGSLDPGQFGNGQLASVELTVPQAGQDDIVDEALYVAWAGFLHGARSGFHGIGEAYDAGFSGRWAWSRGAKIPFIDLFLSVCGGLILGFKGEFELGPGLMVEIGEQAGAVVFAYNAENRIGELVEYGQAEALLDMRGDDQRTHAGRQVIVGISLVHDVFGKERGFHELADIVEV